MTAYEVLYLKSGTLVKPNRGPYKGTLLEVVKTEFGTGARNGWVWLKTVSGEQLLFAGEEITK